MKLKIFFLTCIFFCILLFAISIITGSAKIRFTNVIKCLFSSESVDSSDYYIVTKLRLPRAICALLCGAILSLSGLSFQTVFKNPLADSYILGISSGASFAVALGIMLGLKADSIIPLPFIAFSGAVCTALLLLILSGKKIYSMLLAGVALNFLLSALTTFFFFFNRTRLQNVFYWTMGSLTSSSYQKAILLFAVFILLFSFLLIKNRKMDLLLLNESTTYSLGVKVDYERLLILLVSSFATSVVVAYCGVIGFIGLMCPHIVRQITGPAHKPLIICSAVFGALILSLSDFLAKTLIQSSELPVGIITSVFGAPFFFFLILKKRRTYNG